MSAETTRDVMMRYFEADHKDTSMMADDVAFTDMATGQTHEGPEGVLAMLDYFYRVAFDATAEQRNLIFGDDNAVWEGTFIGTHIGEFAGIPATNRDVRVPLAVVYDVVDGKLARGRIYLSTAVMMQQLGVA
jgi:steroid delta-isomerase-like uncharacterized protein